MLKRHAAAAVVCLVFGVLGAAFLLIALSFFATVRGSELPGEVFTVFPLVFGGMGAVFLATAVIVLATVISGERRREAVRARGQLVQATVTSVRENGNVTVNGRHPYVVECRYEPDGGEAYLLKSGDLWGEAPRLAPGDTVPVYWDAYDKKHYTVDLSGLADANVVDLR